MAMKHVRSGEVDTPEEIAKALNRIIDNVNQTEAKVEQFTGSKKTAKAQKTVKSTEVKEIKKGAPNA